MTNPRDALDRSTPVPLHYQVSHYLRDAISRGEYRPGDLIPPETVLATELGLSRATVRQGIATLVAEGLLSRRRGIGTVVSQRDLEQPLHGLYTFAGLAATAGRELSTHVLRAARHSESTAAGERLGVAGGVIVIDRLRLLDGVPFALESVTLPERRGAALLDGADLTRPLYDLLEERCGITITAAHEEIKPVKLSRREAEMLDQASGDAAFHVERTGLSGEEPVELRVSLIRGDRYLYSVQLARHGASAAGLTGRGD
jgi:GntR family transcriptional regulator